MNKIISKQKLAPNIYRLVIDSEEIAKKRQPGQFIILRIDDSGERIPLTIADADQKAGTLDLIVQAVGRTTKKLIALKTGERIQDVIGPLGVPTKIEKLGTVVMIGGGVGTAPLYPIARAYNDAGNRVITILGARSKELIILQDEFNRLSDQMVITTDDGSLGQKGLVTNALEKLVKSGEKINKVFAIGPLIMMKFVAEMTKKYNIPTIVSLNSLMIDGTGMCGSCRVRVGGEIKFTCVHGPEFDGHQVDFEMLLKRANIYTHEEKCQLDKYIRK